MQSYLGRMISTALPRSSSSRLSPKTTSPRPPAWATGAHSGATITTYTMPPQPETTTTDPGGKTLSRLIGVAFRGVGCAISFSFRDRRPATCRTGTRVADVADTLIAIPSPTRSDDWHEQ